MEDFSSLQSQIQAALVSTTRSASTLANEDLSFHRALSAPLAKDLDRQNARLLGLASSLLGAATATEEIVRSAPSLKDIDAIDGNWQAVVDVVDSLLERADSALDEFTGAVRRLSPGLADKIAPAKAAKPSKIALGLKAQAIEKPQLNFEHTPTNRDSGPFTPLLLSKPHALTPLVTEPITSDEISQRHYPHPFQHEIERYRYPASVYTQADPIPYHPFDSTTATFVDSEDAVLEMLNELKLSREIAIDLEHHDQRSYIGMVSLMQISTRDKDWIVDTLKPWRRKLQCLNEVFADPNILKVLHGAYMDIVWLQRDLGLYVVGLFDTHYASRSLGYPGGSLAYLLKRFANVDAQKQYQMADWRIRPLPQELFDYARSDTHYLLYIFDCMRNELIERSEPGLSDHQGDKLWDVLVRSSETALQRYEHPLYSSPLGEGLGAAGWYKLLSRTPGLLTKEQFSVFRAIHHWRDEAAREQDDSPSYVMPGHQIFSIAREMPTNRAALLGMCQPITQTVRHRASELVNVIIKAKEDGKDGPEMVDVLKQHEPDRSREPRRTLPMSNATPGLSEAQVANNPALSNGTAAPMIPQLPLRSASSTFWGEAFPKPLQDQKRLSSTAQEVSMVLPMPQLTPEVFADSMDTAASSAPMSTLENDEVTQDSSPSRSNLQEQQEIGDDVFILKDLKRKHDLAARAGPIGDAVAAQNDEVSVAVDESKQARKAARREAKRAREAAASINGTTDPAIPAEEPLDYAAAPSILNPPRDARGAASSAIKPGRKQVNPYAKALLDTPKGMPRAPASKERAGQSMTYKS